MELQNHHYALQKYELDIISKGEYSQKYYLSNERRYLQTLYTNSHLLYVEAPYLRLSLNLVSSVFYFLQ